MTEEAQALPPQKPRTWNLLHSFFWMLGIGALFAIIQSVVFFIFMMRTHQATNPDLDMQAVMADENRLQQLLTDYMDHGWVIGWTVLISSILCILIVLAVVKMKKGSNVLHYLNIVRPSIKQVLLWIGVAIAYIFALELLMTNIDTEAFETDFMANVVATGPVWLLIISVGILGPIWEEVFFRGFLFKPIEQSKLGGHAAVAITSVVFVLIHGQYNWAILVAMLPLALILGYARFYSKSLVVPVIIHILNNSASVILTHYGMV